MSDPVGKNTCENGDNFTFEAEPDATGKKSSAKNQRKSKLVQRIIIVLLFVASLPFLTVYFLLYLAFAQPRWWTDFNEWLHPEEKIDFVPGPPYEGPHTMLFMGGVMSAREGDILKVVVREIKEPGKSFPHPWDFWHIYDPEGRDFAGMAARYFTGGTCGGLDGVIFEDGSVFCSHKPPPGAIRIGSPARYNEMRWRRFWKDYYLVAVYRGEAGVIDEWLMREKDGKNIGMILGESNLQDTDNTFEIYGSCDSGGNGKPAAGFSAPSFARLAID